MTQKTSMLPVDVLSSASGKLIPCPRTPGKALDAESVASAIGACAIRQMGVACCCADPWPGGAAPASVAASCSSMDAAASLEALSRSERIVLSQLASGARVGQIAARLSRSPKTVSTQKASIMRKLGAATDFDLHRLISRLRLDEATRDNSGQPCRHSCKSEENQGGEN